MQDHKRYLQYVGGRWYCVFELQDESNKNNNSQIAKLSKYKSRTIRMGIANITIFLILVLAFKLIRI